MGNKIQRMFNYGESHQLVANSENREKFPFHGEFEEDTNNGLYFNNTYVPEEILIIILSHIDAEHILKASLVCRKWCNMIKSTQLWTIVYNRKYPSRPLKTARLPWYLYYCLFATDYFDRNLLKNGNGQEGFKYWHIVKNYGDEFKIEDPPIGADPLPSDCPEFNGRTSCFATSFYECNKLQIISFERSNLLQFILNKHKPYIYLSEWVAGRFDCGCEYTLWCRLIGDHNMTGPPPPDDWETMIGSVLYTDLVKYSIEQWAGSKWTKVELVVKDYPNGVDTIVFQHEGRDTLFWKGHYGSKMAGGVVKILFDTIQA